MKVTFNLHPTARDAGGARRAMRRRRRQRGGRGTQDGDTDRVQRTLITHLGLTCRHHVTTGSTSLTWLGWRGGYSDNG